MYPETSEHVFWCLYRDCVFYEYLISGFRKGKPSKFLLGTSKILHEHYEKGMEKDLLEAMEKDRKAKLKELLEFLKPEVS